MFNLVHSQTHLRNLNSACCLNFTNIFVLINPSFFSLYMCKTSHPSQLCLFLYLHLFRVLSSSFIFLDTNIFYPFLHSQKSHTKTVLRNLFCNSVYLPHKEHVMMKWFHSHKEPTDDMSIRRQIWEGKIMG